MATAALISPDVLVPSGTTNVDGRTEPGDILPSQRQETPRFVRVTLKPAGQYTALPSDFLFGALRHPALRLLKPIPLRTERSSEGISVIWEEGQEFGFGESFSAAIDDFSGTIAELYFRLSHGEETLGADLSALRDKLSGYIQTRHQ